jgi:cellulose biosynthesis protein BcsQ
MKTLAIISQKGGAGKTTLFVHLATAATLSGHSVAIIDLDPQGTAASWGDRRRADAPEVYTWLCRDCGHVHRRTSPQGSARTWSRSCC